MSEVKRSGVSQPEDVKKGASAGDTSSVEAAVLPAGHVQTGDVGAPTEAASAAADTSLHVAPGPQMGASEEERRPIGTKEPSEHRGRRVV